MRCRAGLKSVPSMQANLSDIDWAFSCTGKVYCSWTMCGVLFGTVPVLPGTPCCSSFNALSDANCDGYSPDTATMKALAYKAIQDCADDPFTENEVMATAIPYITSPDQCSGSAGEETVNVVAEDPIRKAVVATSQADNTDVALAKVV